MMTSSINTVYTRTVCQFKKAVNCPVTASVALPPVSVNVWLLMAHQLLLIYRSTDQILLESYPVWHEMCNSVGRFGCIVKIRPNFITGLHIYALWI